MNTSYCHQPARLVPPCAASERKFIRGLWWISAGVTLPQQPAKSKVSERVICPPPSLRVVDSYGEWTSLWESQFSALNIPHLRSHTLVHTDPVNKVWTRTNSSEVETRTWQLWLSTCASALLDRKPCRSLFWSTTVRLSSTVFQTRFISWMKMLFSMTWGLARRRGNVLMSPQLSRRVYTSVCRAANSAWTSLEIRSECVLCMILNVFTACLSCSGNVHFNLYEFLASLTWNSCLHSFSK